jgi:hypothetical protein
MVPVDPLVGYRSAARGTHDTANASAHKRSLILS